MPYSRHKETSKAAAVEARGDGGRRPPPPPRRRTGSHPPDCTHAGRRMQGVVRPDGEVEAGRARDANNTRQAEEQGREPPTSPPPPPVGRRKAPQNGAAPPPNVDRRETTRQHCTAPARTATAPFPPRPPTLCGGNRRARSHTAGIDGSRQDGGCRGHAQSQSSGASCYRRVVASRVGGRTHAPTPHTVCPRALTGPPRGKEAAGARHPPSASIFPPPLYFNIQKYTCVAGRPYASRDFRSRGLGSSS